MASIRTIGWHLADEVKRTQRRVNALDKIVIPESEETKKYIENVLEEKAKAEAAKKTEKTEIKSEVEK